QLQAPGSDPVTVRVRGRADAAEVAVGDGDPQPARAHRDGDRLWVALDGLTVDYDVVHAGGSVWLAADGHVTNLRDHERLASSATAAGGDGVVTAPMPGTVTVLRAQVGDRVEAGTPLLVVEAMKMEHVLTAPVAGTVTELGVTAGQSVRLDERVAVVTPTAPADERQET
ncbi:MAG: acetyl-CoA carboxylase biotin carboxyl carrier protein subunit, partial [Actinomycetes bacterium]